MELLPYYGALGLGILLGVLGQLALKAGSGGEGGFLGQFLNPYSIIGLAIYFAAALCYMVSIKKIPVSLAYPSVSVSYLVVGLAAHFLWGEPFGLPQFAGIVLICGGILLLHQ